MNPELDAFYARLYAERNGDPQAERYRPVPDPPQPKRRRPCRWEPVGELDATRNRRDLEDALDGIAYDPPAAPAA